MCPMGHIDVANSLPLIKYDKVILEKKPQIEAALKAGKIIVYTVRTSIAQTLTNLPPNSQRWVTISQSIAALGRMETFRTLAIESLLFLTG